MLFMLSIIITVNAEPVPEPQLGGGNLGTGGSVRFGGNRIGQAGIPRYTGPDPDLARYFNTGGLRENSQGMAF